MKITVEDLIKLASQAQSTLTNVENTHLTDVERFILDMNIKTGLFRIRTKALYNAYTLWSRKPLTRKGFSHKFNYYFDVKGHGSHHWYHLLNYKPIQLLNAVDNKKLRVK